ncbi:hypothetical protein SSTU70S_06227 [Stutzerimonas stutzeri]
MVSTRERNRIQRVLDLTATGIHEKADDRHEWR